MLLHPSRWFQYMLCMTAALNWLIALGEVISAVEDLLEDNNESFYSMRI